MSEEQRKAIDSSDTAWQLIAWVARAQETDELDSAQLIERVANAMEEGDPVAITLGLVGHGAVLVRLLANAQGVSLDEVIRQHTELGTLAHLEAEFEDDE